MNNKKLFTKAISVSLAAAMVLTMAPVNATAAKTAKVKKIKAPHSSMIKVNQTKTIVATRNAKKSNNDIKYVRFSPKNTKNIGISVKTSDDAVVSVKKINNGKYEYTGVNTGEATLTIKTRAANAKGKKLTSKLAVTVINPFKATQTGAFTFTMSTADKLDKVTKRDIKVVQEGNTIDNAVKEVKLSEDKMSAEVTMEIPFVDQKKYEVTFGKEKDSFVASVGAPVAINIKTQQAVQNKPTEIKYAIVDAKGMDVTKVLDAAKITVDVTAKTGYYDANSKKLTLWKVGDTAEVKVVYHSWVYDSKTGKENVIEGKGTVTCVDKSSVTVTGLDKWTIADRVLSWDTDTMKTQVPQGENSHIWVRMKKSDGTYVNNKDNASDFTFEPIHTGTLYAYADGAVYATREGMEYVKVTYYDGVVKYQYTLPVTVVAKAKATTLVISQPYVVMVTGAVEPTINTLRVLDQYGEPMELTDNAPMLTHLSGRHTVAGDAATNKGLSKDKTIQKFALMPGEVGAGQYHVAYKDLKITMTVSTQEIKGATDGYRLIATEKELDLDKINEGTESGYIQAWSQGIELRFVSTKAGFSINDAKDKFMTFNKDTDKILVNGSLVSRKDDDTAIADFANNALTNLLSVEGGKLVFTPVHNAGDNKNYVVVVKPGAYTITVVKKIGDKTYTLSDTINVTGKLPAPVKATATDATYSLNGVKLDNTKKADEIAKDMIQNELKDGISIVQTKYVKILERAVSGKTSEITRSNEIAADIKNNAYYLDTAALPVLKTDAADFIWSVSDRLNEKIDKKELTPGISAAAITDKPVFGTEKVLESQITITDLDADGTLTVEKIMLGNVDEQGKFTLTDGGAASGVIAADKKMHIKTTAATPAGDYVATIKYVKGTVTKTTTVNFTVDKADFAAVTDIVANADNTLDFTSQVSAYIELKNTLVHPTVTVVTPATIKVDTNKNSTAKTNTFTVSYDVSIEKLVFTANAAVDIDSDASATATGEVVITVADDNHNAKQFVIKGKETGTTLVTADKKVDVTIAVK